MGKVFLLLFLQKKKSLAVLWKWQGAARSITASRNAGLDGPWRAMLNKPSDDATDKAGDAKIALSTAARGTEAALEAVGGRSATPAAMGASRAPTTWAGHRFDREELVRRAVVRM